MIIAIDPGKNGAIAWANVYSTVKATIGVTPMGDTCSDILGQLNTLSRTRTVAYIEDVGFHVMGNNASSSAKFARHVGHIEMACIACGFEIHYIKPAKWMDKFLGSRAKGMKDKAERKRQIKEKVQQLYPGIKVTLQNADAIAMLHVVTGGEC